MPSDYLPIPGFSFYRIHSQTQEVQSKKRRKYWKPIKMHRNGLIRLVTDDGTSEVAIAPARILYAAQRGIDPTKIDRNLLVVPGPDGELRLLDRAAFAKERTKKKERTQLEMFEWYTQAIQFATDVLEAHKTGDWTKIVTRIWECRGAIVKYLRANKIAITDEAVDEYWMQAFDVVLSSLKERNACIVAVQPYIQRVCRTLHAEKVKLDKMLKSYSDPDSYLNRLI